MSLVVCLLVVIAVLCSGKHFAVMEQSEYHKILSGFIAVPVEDIFKEYKQFTKLNWFHLLCSLEDFVLVLSCKEFKFYTLCRCHQAASDNTFTHEHIHAIISSEIQLLTWKRRLIRKKIRLTKTTFKRILCGDHLCGVIRYICCKDGQIKKGVDGLVRRPHIHYDRRVDVRAWLHQRGPYCCPIRKAIAVKMRKNVNEPLHDYKSCSCDRGFIGQQKRKEANRKRREFYNTEAGKLVKQRYKEKNDTKEKIIQQILDLEVGHKSELRRQEMVRLLKML